MKTNKEQTMKITISTTYGETGATVHAALDSQGFPTVQQAERFAKVLTNSPSEPDPNTRFGWALGYIARENEGTANVTIAPLPSLLDQVIAAAPLKDGWYWSAAETYINLISRDGRYGPQSFGTVYFDEYWERCEPVHPRRVGFGEFTLPISVSVTDGARQLADRAGALA